MLLGRFFEASRQYDLTALDACSTVVFNPRTQGTVTTFNIVTVSAERRRRASAADHDIIERSLDDAPTGSIELVAEDVTVRAPVRLNGVAAERTLVVTIQRAVRNDVRGRWVVTGVN